MKTGASSSRQGNARTVALAVLERAANLPVQAGLDEALSRAGLSRQDAGLATELVYGWLRWEIRLAWLLARHLRAPEKLPPVMRVMLGLAAYELLHLDRIPARATVHTWVEMVRRRFGQGLGRVANGVLRALADAGPDALQGAWYDGQIDGLAARLAVACATPLWMVQLWLDERGEAVTRELLAAGQTTPWSCVRVNAARAGAAACRDSLLGEAGNLAVGAWGVLIEPANRGDAAIATAHAQGDLSYHGGGSQAALAALIPAPVRDVWDACAGRGGKTLALVEQGSQVRVASDTSAARLAGMAVDAQRLGLPVPHRYVGSGTLPAFAGQVQTILLDVPCSGLGTLARRPDIRRLQQPGHLPGLYALQAGLRESAWQRLAPGGLLVYMTCAVNQAENEVAVRQHLAAHGDAELLNEWTNDLDPLRVATGMDALYGAVLRKR